VARLDRALGKSNPSPTDRELDVWTSYARVLFASHEFSYVD
jgi:hypothetical protein